MRKMLEIQLFLEYSMLKNSCRLTIHPSPYGDRILCSKMKQYIWGGSYSLIRHFCLNDLCRNMQWIPSLLWMCGLLSGTLLFCYADNSLVSTMRAVAESGMSISGLLCVLFFPLLITAFAAYFSQPFLLFPVIFLKALFFSFVGTGFLTSFQSCGWLVCFFLMFSDFLGMPLLWIVWIRCFHESRRKILRSCYFTAVAFLLIGCFDYAFVAPFLARLIFFGKG